MSGTLDRAQKLGPAEVGCVIEQRERPRSPADQQELEEQISDRRAKEFIRLMEQCDIPMVGYYLSDYHRVPCNPECIYAKEIIEYFEKFVGNGWVVLTPNIEDNNSYDGLVLLKDSRAYRWYRNRAATETYISWGLQRTSTSIETSDVVSPRGHLLDVQVLAPFADDDGLEILVVAAAKYGVV